jgi:hypothetical protein
MARAAPPAAPNANWGPNVGRVAGQGWRVAGVVASGPSPAHIERRWPLAANVVACDRWRNSIARFVGNDRSPMSSLQLVVDYWRSPMIQRRD